HGDQQALLGERRATFEMNVASAAVAIVLVLLGAWLESRAACTAGDLVAMMILHQRMFMSLKQILSHWANAEENSDYLSSLVLDAATVPKTKAMPLPLDHAIDSITLCEADFAVGDTVLLTDVSCRLEKGHLYGVAGA